MEKFNFIEFEKTILHCSPLSSLFDFVALHSCNKSRESVFLRLRRLMSLENYPFSLIWHLVADDLKGKPIEYAFLLRFLRVYWCLTDNELPVFLQAFNDFYHCGLNMSDFELKTPELF